MRDKPGNTKGGSITVLLTSCLTGLESADDFFIKLQNRIIQTSQKGGQFYCDTSPLVFLEQTKAYRTQLYLCFCYHFICGLIAPIKACTAVCKAPQHLS